MLKGQQALLCMRLGVWHNPQNDWHSIPLKGDCNSLVWPKRTATTCRDGRMQAGHDIQDYTSHASPISFFIPDQNIIPWAIYYEIR